jgi:hypothetical protein
MMDVNIISGWMMKKMIRMTRMIRRTIKTKMNSKTNNKFKTIKKILYPTMAATLFSLICSRTIMNLKIS